MLVDYRYYLKSDVKQLNLVKGNLLPAPFCDVFRYCFRESVHFLY